MAQITPAVEQAMAVGAARSLSARSDSVKPTVVHCLRVDTDHVNGQELSRLDGKEHVYDAIDEGVAVFLKHCPAPERVALKVGYAVNRDSDCQFDLLTLAPPIVSCWMS
jgi:hypothetical protein